MAAPPMSALGQKQTFQHSMSALPPKADIVECNRHVRFVPKADISVRWVEAKGRISVSPLHAAAPTWHDTGVAKTKFTTQWGHTPPSCGTAQCATPLPTDATVRIFTGWHIERRQVPAF